MTTYDPTAQTAPEVISTAILSRRLHEPGLVIVDVRALAAFNGWRLRDEARGGHLPGAVAFPIEWLTTVEPAELDRLVESKGLAEASSIVVYGDGLSDSATFAHWFLERGPQDIAVLDPGFDAWATNPNLPLERLPGFERLVHPVWVRQLLSGGKPATHDGGPSIVLHVNFGVPEEYAEGHIPGAVYLDTNWLEDPADWNRRSPAEIEAALLRLGIARDTLVVVYGRDTVGHANEKWPGRRAGQIAATRAALILRYAGVRDVRLLDGGYDRWLGAGLPVEATPTTPAPVSSFGAAIPAHPGIIVDIEEAKAILADERAALVSVRTWREHTGQVSGYNYIGPAGRIAGDVWGNCGTDAYHMQHYRNSDNTMRAYPEIAANWADAGITPDLWVAFYCGTGWRAAETWFYADLMGWPRIAVYDGGWFEWSQDPLNNPIEIGVPADETGEAAA